MTVATGTQVRSLSRALGLLEHVADRGGATLSELAHACDLPLSTAHRIVRALVGSGYLHEASPRRYHLGPGLVALGGAVLEPPVHRWLDELVAATGETATAATLQDGQVMWLVERPSPHAMRTCTDARGRAPVHGTAAGKALLSLVPDGDLPPLVGRLDLTPCTARTLTSPVALLATVRDVRRRGHATEDEEGQPGVRGVAVPVPGAPFPLALTVTGPVARLGVDRVPDVAALLRRTVAAG